MKFSNANRKLKKLYKLADTRLSGWLDRKIGRKSAKVYSFDLLAGIDCPMAHLCRSRVVVDDTGKRRIKDGPFTKFRCFSASEEVLFTNVYNLRKQNHDDIHALDDCEFAMADAICAVLPDDAAVVRIHVSGDFFNRLYFRAWLLVACRKPHILFYAYTKSLDYWIDNRSLVPNNMLLTASVGGRHDHLIAEHNLRSAVVVFSTEEAERLDLEIDDDDSSASDPAMKDRDFALLIHGAQPAGSEASKALQTLKKNGQLPVLN